MRIEDLKIFVDVVQTHSMNAAAEKNFTTPQNLSKIVKRMENDLGIILFKRSKKGSELTVEGEIFYLRIVEVLRHYDDAMCSIGKNIIGDAPDRSPVVAEKTIRVLCTSGGLSYAVMESFNKIQQGNGSLALEEEEIGYYDSTRLIRHVKEENFDIIACLVLQEEIDSIVRALSDYLLLHVIFDEVVLVVSTKNVLAKRSVISVSELEKLKMIAFKKTVQIEELIELDMKCKIMTNSHAKVLEQVRHSESYCTLLFKSFCMLNATEFSENGDFKMIRLDQKIYGTYVIMIRQECMVDMNVLHFVRVLEEEF